MKRGCCALLLLAAAALPARGHFVWIVPDPTKDGPPTDVGSASCLQSSRALGQSIIRLAVTVKQKAEMFRTFPKKSGFLHKRRLTPKRAATRLPRAGRTLGSTPSTRWPTH